MIIRKCDAEKLFQRDFGIREHQTEDVFLARIRYRVAGGIALAAESVVVIRKNLTAKHAETAESKIVKYPKVLCALLALR
jgi:hypothetical protein